MSNDIKAILFDFMGVLLLKKQGYIADPVVDAIDKEIGQVTNDIVFKNQVMEQYQLNEIDFEKILEKIDEKYEVNNDLWKLLPDLRSKYKLAIINNGTVLTLPMFEKSYDIKGNFDLYINSAIEGIKKPDPKIYLLTAERLGVSAEQCLYMDDIEVNVMAAERLGMKVIWWKNKEKGMKEFLDYISD
jgi:epoxide hydrolase-like predicted phosphatase